MTDEQKLAYSEAGNWVRMANTVTWTLAGVFAAILVAAIYMAMTTSVPRWLLVSISVVVGGFWFWIDRVYENTAVAARNILVGLERTKGFEGMRLYTEQSKAIPGWYSTNIHLLAILALLLVGWVIIWDIPPVPPVK